MDNSYAESRKHFLYYKYLRELLPLIIEKNDVVYDIGSNGTDMLSYLICRKKISIDIENPFCDRDVVSIKDDFLSVDIEDADVITCFQVIEHIRDESIFDFAKKLLKAKKFLIISVPYKWKRGVCKSHVQDPIDENKINTWFNKEPLFTEKIVEKNGVVRLIAVFKTGIDSKNMHSVRIDVFKNFMKKNGLMIKREGFLGHFFAYILRSTDSNEIKSIIFDYIITNTCLSQIDEIVLYGFGNNGRALFDLLKKTNKIVAVVDEYCEDIPNIGVPFYRRIADVNVGDAIIVSIEKGDLDIVCGLRTKSLIPVYSFFELVNNEQNNCLYDKEVT